MTPEAKVKKEVRKILDELDCYYFFPATGGFGVSGLFDICVVYKGVFIGIECKADKTKYPTLLQSRNAKFAKAAGSVVLLIHIDNTDLINNLIERIDNEPPTQFSNASFWTPDSSVLE
jgi:hypothetical protein